MIFEEDEISYLFLTNFLRIEICFDVLILLIYLGLFLNYFALMVFSQTSLSPSYYLISSVCGSVFGGFAVLIVVFICYASDISESEKKAWNLSLVDIYFCLGSLAGLALSPLVFHNFGYFPVFVSSALICLVACIFSVLFVEETIQYTGNEVQYSPFIHTSLRKCHTIPTRVSKVQIVLCHEDFLESFFSEAYQSFQCEF